jgi:PAS domain S-box-containing protein
MILLVLWHRDSSLKKKKKQALILILSISITVFLFNLEPFILPSLLPYNSTLVSPIFGIIWVTGVWYAIGKYKFLDLHDSEIYRSIIDNTDDLITLFNENLEIKLANKAFREVTGFDTKKLTGNNISSYYQLNEKFYEKIHNSWRGDLHTRVLIHTASGSILTSTIIFSVLDSGMDFAGYAAVSTVVHSISKLEEDYSLSRREAEVVKYIISGTKNSRIAETLGITLRTVKTHVTNIYNKLGIENRIQLINLFNIYEKK